MISVVIPTLNEEKTLPILLDRLDRKSFREILVVDGGSQDRTTVIAQQKEVSLLGSKPGLAQQLNCGALQAKGDLLFFLPADALPPENVGELILRTMNNPSVVGGGFFLNISSSCLQWKLPFQLLSFGANLRSLYWGYPLGDQGMFIRRQDFLAVGGFSHSAIIEEADLWERVRERGEIVLVRSSMGTSDRKWQRLGLVRTTWWHWKLCWQHQKDRYNKEVKERYEWVRRTYRENGSLS